MSMAPKYNLNHVTQDYPFMTCLVKVHTRSSWQKTVTKVLNKCHGIYSFRMDDNGVAEISGTVDPNLLLKMLGKAGSKAELHWLQFGECSSNLFMPANLSDIGYYHEGTVYSQDGRYLHPGNLPRPKLPSQGLRSPAHNKNLQYQIGYDHRHGYDQYANNHNHHYQLTYDHNHDYDHRHDNQHYVDGYQYNYGDRHDRNRTRYHPVGSEDRVCCRVM